MTASAIYEGTVRHRRLSPKPHEFTYRMFMMYVDLDEMPDVLDPIPLWSARGRAPACFRRSDYLGDPERTLKEAVQDLVEERTGTRPDGPIRMLAHLRYFGYCFNPVTFYYCFDPEDQRVDAIVAEIENTPWGERHAYVLDRMESEAHRTDPDPTNTRSEGRGRGRRISPVLRFRFEKRFHVSPFQDMDLDYDWRFREPDDRLAVHMKTFDQGQLAFDATLALRRREMAPGRMVGLLFRYPFLTGKVLAGIYWQALRLKLKGFRFYPHPAKRNPTTTEVSPS